MGGSPPAQNSDSDDEPIDGAGMSSPPPLGADNLERLLSDSPVRQAQDDNRQRLAPSADEWIDLFADHERREHDRRLSAGEPGTLPQNEPRRRSRPDDPVAHPGFEHLFTTIDADGIEPTAPEGHGSASPSIGAPKPVHRGRSHPDTLPPRPTRSTEASGFVFVVDGERRSDIGRSADMKGGSGTEGGPDVRPAGMEHPMGDRLAGSVLGEVAWPALTAQPPSRSVRSPGQARRRLSFLPYPLVEVGSPAQIWGVVLAATMVVAGAGAWSTGALDWLRPDGPAGVTLSGTTEGVTPAAPVDDAPGRSSSARARSGGLGPVSSLVSGTQGTSGIDDAGPETPSEPDPAVRARTTVAEPQDGGSGGSVAGTSSSSTTGTTAEVTSSTVPTTATSTSLTSGSGSGSTTSTSTTSTTQPETTTTTSGSNTTTSSSTSTSTASTTTSVQTTTASTGKATTSTSEPPEGGG